LYPKWMLRVNLLYVVRPWVTVPEYQALLLLLSATVRPIRKLLIRCTLAAKRGLKVYLGETHLSRRAPKL